MINNKHRVALGLLALMTLGGCASINDCCYEKTQSVRAVKEYIKCGQPECSTYPHDYKLGWIDGFYEVATGGDPCPPALAPQRYWKVAQILDDCDNRRHAYYSGWQDGASRASQFPDTHYLRIYETCETPFPRCDKPCGDGTCGPCTIPFIGMPASSELIEAAPLYDVPPTPMLDVAPAVTERAEDHDIDSSSNKPQAAETNESVETLPTEPLPTEPLVTPEPDDAAALTVPQPRTFEMVVEEELDAQPAKQVESNFASPPKELVLIPGRSYTIAPPKQSTSTNNVQQQGVIRLVTAPRPVPSTDPLTDDQRIVVIGSSNVPFEMIEVEPVVKLAE